MTKLPKLTVDIFDRPDCPEWAQWAAVDECGDAYVYDTKPVKQSEDWHTDEGGDFIGEYDKSSLSKFGELLDKRKKSGWKNPAPVYDDVKAPSYYVNTPFGLEVRKITEHYDPYIAAALKYIFRNGQKVYDGLTAKESAIKDLRKAIQNIKFEIEKIENS